MPKSFFIKKIDVILKTVKFLVEYIYLAFMSVFHWSVVVTSVINTEHTRNFREKFPKAKKVSYVKKCSPKNARLLRNFRSVCIYSSAIGAVDDINIRISPWTRACLCISKIFYSHIDIDFVVVTYLKKCFKISQYHVVNGQYNNIIVNSS